MIELREVSEDTRLVQLLDFLDGRYGLLIEGKTTFPQPMKEVFRDNSIRGFYDELEYEYNVLLEVRGYQNLKQKAFEEYPEEFI